MSKLMWVLLPIAAAAAVVGALALRGKMPARPVLNVWFSLLLLAYVLTTAGLGLFWVANQQLPVFDWHYLFGYSVLLLLVLHLGFNFRVVWQTLRRRRGGAASQAAPAATVRRPVLGWLSVLGAMAAAGIGYFVGLRHGRTELRIDAVNGSAASALALVEEFHTFSAHTRAGVLRRSPGADWGDPPPPFKAYAARPELALPRLPARAAGFDIAALGAALWHTAGISARSGPIHFRTSPSSGALFATELYVVARSVAGVAPGLWHYEPQSQTLSELRRGAVEDLELGIAAGTRGALAVVIATAVFRRSGHKYRDRTYRYVLADLGHALENLRVAAAAVGATATLLRAFDESRIAALLGADEGEEGVLAVALLHRRGEAPASESVAAQSFRGPPPDPTSTRLGLTDAMHRMTSLRAAQGSAAAAATAASAAAAVSAAATASAAPSSAAAAGPAPAAAPLLLPRVASALIDPLRVIERRRSLRRFATAPLGLADLSACLAALSNAAPLLSDAVRIDLIAHAVQGLEPAAWRYDPKAHALALRVRHGREPRARSRAAALDQDVIGDAAAVFVLSISRAAFAADPAGPARGYRHAFIEAGMVGERLYLEGAARGLGVCAVGAFYDDEAAALAGTDPAREWVVHFAALGVPA
jgi:SagB-type dehydrogenase family enzyme